MKSLFISRIKLTNPRFLSIFSMASLMLSLLAFCQFGQAQQAQLSLADILVALRSKKVTLDERNKLLSDAVKVRGITFGVTSEIETELAKTGASNELVEVIRQKGLKITPVSMVKANPDPAPAATKQTHLVSSDTSDGAPGRFEPDRRQ